MGVHIPAVPFCSYSIITRCLCLYQVRLKWNLLICFSIRSTVYKKLCFGTSARNDSNFEASATPGKRVLVALIVNAIINLCEAKVLSMDSKSLPAGIAEMVKSGRKAARFVASRELAPVLYRL